MSSYLLDTNVLSEFKRPRPDANLYAWVDAVNEEKTFVSVISLAEMRFGVSLMPPSRRKTELDQWLADYVPRRFERRVLDVTPSIANAWGELLAQAKRRGLGLGVSDGYIAATAKFYGMAVVTRNVKDFQSLGLDVVNPWRAC